MLTRILIVGVALPFLCGCGAGTESSWHSHIAPGQSTQPRNATDPVTGELLREDFADQEFEHPFTRERAFQILLSTKVFADAYIGNTGTKSAQVEAFQVLLDQPDAVDVFTDLLSRGHLAGQLYGLCGLRLLAPQKYETAERAYLKSDATVAESSGCVTEERTVRDLVHNPGENTVHLKPGETFEQWGERIKPTWTGFKHDISGGATPERFRSAP